MAKVPTEERTTEEDAVPSEVEETPQQNPRPEVKQPPVLFRRTQRQLKSIEKFLDGPLVTYWSTSEGICQGDLVGLYHLMKRLGHQETLYLLIKSRGGSAEVALRITNLLRTFCDRVVALVPFECASAATMLALGADEIRMGEMAFLSPVDTSLYHSLSPVDLDNRRVRVSLDHLKRVVSLWRDQKRKDATVNPFELLFHQIHPLVIGAVDRAESLSVRLCQEILSFHLEDQKKAQRIAVSLNADYPSHTYPITLPEARRLGLNASPLEPELNRELLVLNELYSEMGQVCRTDFRDGHYHDNEIINVMEAAGLQIFFQADEEWIYRPEERFWTSFHNDSAWHRLEMVKNKVKRTQLHLR